MPGDGAVHEVEQRWRKTGEEASSETRERHGLQELYEPVPVAGDGSVSEREAPGRVPLVLLESAQ